MKKIEYCYLTALCEFIR